MNIVESGDESLNFIDCERDDGASNSGDNCVDCVVESDGDAGEA